MNRDVEIITLGCKVNQSESEALAARCRQIRGREGRDGLCIINTCAVTQKAEMQSRQAVRKAIRSNPNATVVVTGCYAQRDPQAFSRIPGVDYIIGQADKHRIPEITTGAVKHCDSQESRQPEPVIRHSDISGYRRFDAIAAPPQRSRTRPFLKIQDGCDAFCTYCIVPHTRGRSRSLPPENAACAFRELLAAGAPEIVLSGIHIGKYGADLEPQTTLDGLLGRLDAIPGNHRIRLSSIEPTEITDDLLDRVRGSARICPHFHVPLQSGDPRILERMKRPYDPALFSERIEAIRSRFPEAAIGVDVLVGFPGEDEAAFARTLELIRRLPVTYLHVFPYSPRPATPAARFENPVAPARIKERCRQMHALSREKKIRFYRRMVGKTLDVIIEKNADTENGPAKGLSENYIPVYVEKAGPWIRRTGCRIASSHADQWLKGAAV